MWDRNEAKPFLVATWHIVGALLLAYLFIVVLMTASSQSRVAATLTKLSKPLDYSSAFATWQRGDELARSLGALRGERRRLLAQRDAATKNAEELSDSVIVMEAPLLALAEPLQRVPGCAPTSADPRPAAPDLSPTVLVSRISLLRRCQTSAALSPALKAEIEDTLSAATDMVKSSRALLRVEREVDRIDSQLKAADGAIREQRGELETTADVGARFEELSSLQRRWFLGGGVLTGLPPSIIQIVLAFVSGMFGALLVTLVLVVYPKNDLQLTTTNGNYSGRILLGGLIALCVFVVLGGGTAVLGTNSAFADGDANFLAFSAIAILAGMFSDRVASWLSQRADFFFKQEKEDERIRDSQRRSL